MLARPAPIEGGSLPSAARRLAWPGRPPVRRIVAFGALLVAGVVLSGGLATAAYLAVPAPTGPLPVGRASALILDEARADVWAGAAGRQLALTAWYPAEAGTRAATAGYLPDDERLREGLIASGELDALAVVALGAVRTSSHVDAAVAGGQERYPVVVLSPGNATNVGFYASLAEDLASRGYVVLGVDHPYQVAAVVLEDGSIATYRGDMPGAATPEASLRAKIEERVLDIATVLQRIEAGGMGLPALDGRLDPDRVAVIGHSNGGLAAVETCRRLARVAACVNVDGQAAGGAFGVDVTAAAPAQPFLFLTKERDLHPVLAERFEAAGPGAYRVVVPAASHGEFADGPRFAPRLLPVDGTADHVLSVERAVIGAFLDSVLGGEAGGQAGERPFDGLDPALDLYIDAYPLGGRPPLPTP